MGMAAVRFPESRQHDPRSGASAEWTTCLGNRRYPNCRTGYLRRRIVPRTTRCADHGTSSESLRSHPAHATAHAKRGDDIDSATLDNIAVKAQQQVVHGLPAEAGLLPPADTVTAHTTPFFVGYRESLRCTISPLHSRLRRKQGLLHNPKLRHSLHSMQRACRGQVLRFG